MNNIVILIHGSRRGLYVVGLPVCACWKIKREGMRIDLQNLNGGCKRLGAGERNKENISSKDVSHQVSHDSYSSCAYSSASADTSTHIIWKNVSAANAGQVASPTHELSQVQQWAAAKRL
jgi:hypothetical protein